MKSSKLLHSLSLRLHGRFSPAPVAPWPDRTAFDKWLSAELDDLRACAQGPSQQCYMGTRFITRALEAAVATHVRALESISTAGTRRVDEKWIDNYMEDVIELLDACNNLRDQMETIRKYMEQLTSAAHYLRGGADGPAEAALQRARVALHLSEEMEGRSCVELDRCGSTLRKLGEKTVENYTTKSDHTELQEALSGAKAVTLVACRMLSMGLSFKSKRGLGKYQAQFVSSWSESLLLLHGEVGLECDKRKADGAVLEELREVVLEARALRGLRCGAEMGKVMESLEQGCRELGDGLDLIERGVGLLYKQLISIRVALLGYLSS